MSPSAGSSKRPSVPFALLVVLCLVLFAALVHLFLTRGRGGEDLPRLFLVPAFALTSEQGKPVTRADLEGSVWIADFVFTRCGGTCPLMTQKMAGLTAELKGIEAIRFVSFDVDPDRDGVPELAAYAKAAGADPARWSFLRGEKAAIVSLARDGFKLAVVDGDPKDPEPVLHSTRFVLVDAAGTIRGYYDSADPEAMERLQSDARRLASGLRKGTR
jgi:protein SCO1/2